MKEVEEEVLDLIREERVKQREKWGEQNCGPMVWVCIAAEELGEASEAALDYVGGTTGVGVPGAVEAYVGELVHLGAVCVAAVECALRNDLGRTEKGVKCGGESSDSSGA